MQTQNTFDPDPFYDSQEWRRLHAAVLTRDHHRCRYCGAEGNQADHVIPRKKGGGDALDNLVCCCSWCNGAALNRRFPSFEKKRDWLRQQRKIQEADQRAGRPDRFARRLAVLQEARERGMPLYKIHKERNWERKRRRQQPRPVAGDNNGRK
jgi:hypothetical protein